MQRDFASFKQDVRDEIVADYTRGNISRETLRKGLKFLAYIQPGNEQSVNPETLQDEDLASKVIDFIESGLAVIPDNTPGWIQDPMQRMLSGL